MRPVALVFGFAFSFFIINIAMWFGGVGLSTFMGGMLANVWVGPVAAFGSLSIILGTIFMILRYVLRMVTHLPDNLPRWIGGQGNNVGDMSAAEGGNQAMQGGAKSVAQGGFAVKSQRDQRAERKVAADAASEADAERDVKLAKMIRGENPGGSGEKDGGGEKGRPKT